jgi:galactokinase
MAKYNRASRLVSTLLELWRAGTGRDDRCLADAVRSSADAPDRLRRIIAGRPHAGFDRAALSRRLEQFLGESERIVPAAAAALDRGALDVFGALVDESQRQTEELLENQVPQTIHLARAARRCGALAASAFGAGFGGSVWALVKADAAGDLLAAWAARYRAEFPAEAARSSFFLSGAGPGLIEREL